jgi:hypothetical protein
LLLQGQQIPSASKQIKQKGVDDIYAVHSVVKGFQCKSGGPEEKGHFIH